MKNNYDENFKEQQAVDFLIKRWQSINAINKGDTLLLHSDVSRTLFVLKKNNLLLKDLKYNVNIIIRSFLELLGKEGTLITPLFNFKAYPINKFFSLKTTKSKMGVLTEVARTQFEGVRTGHPIYSFYVMGSKASLFEGLDNKSGYGKDSPFALLKTLNGKIATLDQRGSMTFFHFIEEQLQVDYRYYKTFTGLYEDLNGERKQKEYTLYVRDLEKNIETHIFKSVDLMYSEGLLQGDLDGHNTGLKVIDANKFYDRIVRLIAEQGALGYLYIINDHNS